MLKYYYLANYGDIYIGYTTKEKLEPDQLEITKEKFEQLQEKTTKDTVFYLDCNNELQVRDRLNKWDEKTKTWIPDKDAINNETRQKLINEALILLKQTDDWGLHDRCSDSPEDHVNQMIDYRKQLRAIVRNKVQTDKLPDLPDFMQQH